MLTDTIVELVQKEKLRKYTNDKEKYHKQREKSPSPKKKSTNNVSAPKKKREGDPKNFLLAVVMSVGISYERE